jgi:hypothetical protein
VLRLEGSLTGPFAEEAAEHLRQAAAVHPAPRTIVVDLARCSSIDSLGVAALGELKGRVPVSIVGIAGWHSGHLLASALPPGVQMATRRAALAGLRDRPPSAPARERRRHPRVTVIRPAALRWRNAEGGVRESEVEARDISEGGLGVRVSAGLRDALQASGASAVQVCVQLLLGKRWVRGALVPHAGAEPQPSVGIQFTRLGERARARIRRLVAGSSSG